MWLQTLQKWIDRISDGPMNTSDNGRAFIEKWEGLYLTTYDDGTGVPTIGYGHTTAAGPPVVEYGQTITQEQADQILAADLQAVERQVNQLVKVPVNQNQYDALVSFQFNTGWLGHSHCSLLNALNSGNYNLASLDFMLYNRASGRILQGLTNRRTAERALFLTPET